MQGERKGQENLKNDLVRRIKMLEYALKQERLVSWVSYNIIRLCSLCAYDVVNYHREQFYWFACRSKFYKLKYGSDMIDADYKSPYETETKGW